LIVVVIALLAGLYFGRIRGLRPTPGTLGVSA
jgi:hypothetical protein